MRLFEFGPMKSAVRKEATTKHFQVVAKSINHIYFTFTAENSIY